MSTIPTLFKSVADLITISSTVSELKADFKRIQTLANELDKRLIRIEAFFEIMKMPKQSLPLE